MTEEYDITLDMMPDLLNRLRNNEGVRLTSKPGSDSIYLVGRVTVEHLKEHGRRKDKFNIVCALVRPVSAVFADRLENTYYAPRTEANRLIQCIYFKWNDIMFNIVVIPYKDKRKAEKLAKKVGGRLVDGVPTIIGSEDPKINLLGVPAEQFPLSNKYTYTLEGIQPSQP